MIVIIIHNFFPSAAELLAGFALFACLFDICCIAPLNSAYPPFFYLVSFFSYYLFSLFLIFMLCFSDLPTKLFIFPPNIAIYD